MDLSKFTWTREPKGFTVDSDKITVITKPFTDLWQRTYYHFRNDNAPVLQMTTDERYFSFGECMWAAHDGQQPDE